MMSLLPLFDASCNFNEHAIALTFIIYDFVNAYLSLSRMASSSSKEIKIAVANVGADEKKKAIVISINHIRLLHDVGYTLKIFELYFIKFKENKPQSFMEEVKKFGDLQEKDILKLIKDGFSTNKYTKNQMEMATNIQSHKKEGAICNDLFGCIFKNKHDNAKYSHIPAQI